MGLPRTVGAIALLATAACHRDPAGPSPASVVVSLCNSPIWVAYQNGDGPWTRTTGDSAGRFHLDVTGRGGLVVVSRASVGYTTAVYYRTAAQFADFASECSSDAAVVPRTVNVTVPGLTSGIVATVALGESSRLLYSPQPVATFTDVPTGQ
jgi:hypothetical protein